MEDRQALIEALIFASESPLSLERISEITEIADRREIDHHLREIMRQHEERQGGICLQAVAGGYQFRTKTGFAPWIKKLKGGRAGLTPAAMETLAVIAYRQPAVKSDIDRIRGVDAGGSLKTLLEKKLVRIMGRKDVPGKPILYGTTKRFLEVFNLQNLSDLPTLKEFAEIKGLQE